MSSAALASSVPGSVPLPALPILFVDDEPENLTLVRLTFGEQFQVLTASGGPEALAILEKRDVGVLVSDERMPVMGGIELLARASERWPDTVRVIVSAYGDVSRVLAALNRGQASEYILKPWAPDDLRGCLTRSLAIADRRRTLRARAELASVLCENGTAPGRALVGWSGGLAPIAGLVERLAGTDVTVLITGETGTGKEQVARAIHARSARRDQPFVPVNCGALAEGLLESELFGHEAGAFTGAARTRKGRFELAHGGTLFLDEIGDISPRMQVALLRVLQERCLERVGGGRSIAVDVRIVAATHRDLRALVRDGRALHRQVPSYVSGGRFAPTRRRDAGGPCRLPMAGQRARARKHGAAGDGPLRRGAPVA
jgi:DNA-binding NtrC family response regulator